MLGFLFMKLLELHPARYDAGLRLLTRGNLEKTYDRLTAYFREGDRVLDLGCGTGSLALRAAARGAWVTGIDVNPRMLAVARERLALEGLADRVELREMGVAELDREAAESFDVVVSGLCLSELSRAEVAYALVQARRILKPGGLLCVADEVRPETFLGRLLQILLRLPLVIVILLSARRPTRPLSGLPGRVEELGFRLRTCRRNGLGSFMELTAEKGGPR